VTIAADSGARTFKSESFCATRTVGADAESCVSSNCNCHPARSSCCALRLRLRRSKKAYSQACSPRVNPWIHQLAGGPGQFHRTFPRIGETAEIYHLKGAIHKRIENSMLPPWIADVAGNLPDSKFATEANKGLKDLSGNKLKKSSDDQDDDGQAWLASARARPARGNLPGFSGHAARSRLRVPIAAECAAFLVYNGPISTRTASCMHRRISRRSSAKSKWRPTISTNCWRSILQSVAPGQLLSLGTIQRKGLKQYDQAAAASRRSSRSIRFGRGQAGV